MGLEMFVPGDRLKYLARGVKFEGLGRPFHLDNLEEAKKTMFGSDPGLPHKWHKQIGRVAFQESGKNHPRTSRPII